MFKVSLRIAVAIFMFLVLVPNVFSQSDTENSPQEITLSTDESSIQLDFSDTGTAKTAQNDVSSVWLFVRMILVLIVVIVILYAIFFFLKRTSKLSNFDDPFLRRVSKISLEPGKSVQIVTLVDHAYMLGVSDNSVNLITEITDKELIDSMNLYSDKNQNIQKPRSFADVLDLFMPHGPRSSVFFDSTLKNASDMLKKQRERFNDNNGE